MFVIENLDDDDGAAERRGHRQIKRVERPGVKWEPQRPEKDDAQNAAAKNLRDAGEGDGATGSEYLFQVDFQSDHVEQQDQSQLGDRGDGFVVFNESDADRSHQKTGDQVSENDRLFEDLRRHREQPRGDDANGDVR